MRGLVIVALTAFAGSNVHHRAGIGYPGHIVPRATSARVLEHKMSLWTLLSPARAVTRGDRRELTRIQPASLSMEECVWQLLSHDLNQLRLTLRGEAERCTRAIQRELKIRCLAPNATAEGEGIGEGALAIASTPSLFNVKAHLTLERLGADAVLAARGALEGSRRLSVTIESSRARLGTLLGSYMHWRGPLLFWWAWHASADLMQPFTPLLASLAPALRPSMESISADLQRLVFRSRRDRAPAQLVKSASPFSFAALSRLSSRCRSTAGRQLRRIELAGGVLALDLTAAIMHLKSPIIAKIKHTTFHEPAAICTFAEVSLRLLLIMFLLQLVRLFGESPGSFGHEWRQQLLRLAMRAAVRASERCYRVERTRSLLPPSPAWQVSLLDELGTITAAAAALGARALEQLSTWRAEPAVAPIPRRPHSLREWLDHLRRPKLRRESTPQPAMMMQSAVDAG